MIAALLKKAANTPALAGVFVSSVRIATTYSGDASLCTLTWSWPEHGEREQNSGLPGVSMSANSRPADSLIALTLPGPTVHEAESAILEAAWSLGAWDVRRIERAPLADPSDWRHVKYGLVADFGLETTLINNQPLCLGDAAPEPAVIKAAQDGWVVWSFIPLALATPAMRNRWGGKDKTLAPDCTRIGQPSFGRLADWHHPDPGFGHEHIYQLGRANHGNRSKKTAERRA